MLKQKYDVGLQYYVLSLPYHKPDGPGIEWRDVHIMLPHEIIGSYYNCNYSFFRETFLGQANAQDLEQYWCRASREPQFKSNSHVIPKHAVPLRLHGDDVAVGKHQSMMVLNLSGGSSDPYAGASWEIAIVLRGAG